jgi:dUTPase
MKIRYKKIDGVEAPKQAHEGEDAAYDIVAVTEPRIVGECITTPYHGFDRKLWSNILFIEYGTNLFIAPEDVPHNEDWLLLKDGETTNWLPRFTKYHTILWPRGSISKCNLTLANSLGLVDGGYRDQIYCRFKYHWQPKDFVFVPEAGGQRLYGIIDEETIYHKGDKIIQITAAPDVPITFEAAGQLPESQRGEGKFGSTGK